MMMMMMTTIIIIQALLVQTRLMIMTVTTPVMEKIVQIVTMGIMIRFHLMCLLKQKQKKNH